MTLHKFFVLFIFSISAFLMTATVAQAKGKKDKTARLAVPVVERLSPFALAADKRERETTTVEDGLAVRRHWQIDERVRIQGQEWRMELDATNRESAKCLACRRSKGQDLSKFQEATFLDCPIGIADVISMCPNPVDCSDVCGGCDGVTKEIRKTIVTPSGSRIPVYPDGLQCPAGQNDYWDADCRFVDFGYDGQNVFLVTSHQIYRYDPAIVNFVLINEFPDRHIARGGKNETFRFFPFTRQVGENHVLAGLLELRDGAVHIHELGSSGEAVRMWDSVTEKDSRVQIALGTSQDVFKYDPAANKWSYISGMTRVLGQ